MFPHICITLVLFLFTAAIFDSGKRILEMQQFKEKMGFLGKKKDLV